MPPRVDSFTDDLVAIPDDAIVYRRVAWDRIGGQANCEVGAVATLNGNCFTDYPEPRARELGYPGCCMSVGVAKVLQEQGFGPEKMLERYPDEGLAWILAADLRKLEKATGEPCPQGLMLVPTDDEPWHGVVFDMATGRKSEAVKKAIAKASAASGYVCLGDDAA
jgi:hypothetical protein